MRSHRYETALDHMRQGSKELTLFGVAAFSLAATLWAVTHMIARLLGF